MSKPYKVGLISAFLILSVLYSLHVYYQFDRQLSVTIPPRPAGAITGSEFARKTRLMTLQERQEAAVAELLRGNIPDFLRSLRPVTASGQSGETSLSATFWVMPDYLAIGSNTDFLRIPLSYHDALTVLHRFNGILPTRKMVDLIYKESSIHLKPQPLPPGSQMNSSDYYLRHQQLIEKQRADQPLGALISGHKKDIVITNRLLEREGRIAIYGWHKGPEDPIQPLSIFHSEEYEDYSHGVRFIGQIVSVNGKYMSILDLLSDPISAPIVTYEGHFEKLEQIFHSKL